MAGLFELQLPNESPRRRSNDTPRSSVAASRFPPSRMHSPPPDITAREIVNQVKAKQQQQERQLSTSSHFPHASTLFSWRRKPATLPHDSPRVSSDSLSGYSSDNLRHSSVPVAIHNSTKRSGKTTTIARSSLTQSPRQSFSHDALEPSTTTVNAGALVSSPLADSFTDTNSSDNQNHINTATTALAQAGFSLSIPSIVFPNPSSPPVTPTVKRKKQNTFSRPGTSHGPGLPSSPSPSAKSVPGNGNGPIRRVKSFTKLEDAMNDQEIVVNNPTPTGDILVFSRHPKSSASIPPTRSMPESSATVMTPPTFSFFSKGKSRETMSDREDMTHAAVHGIDSQRGRTTELPSSGPVPRKDREKSITRRISWWPRRRADSSVPATPSAPVSPPPIPARSQDRPAPVKVPIPSLPSFRPFSPIMNDFRASDVLKEPPDEKDARSTEPLRQSSIRRRHSLSGHSNQSHSTIRPISSSRPTSQTYSVSHKYSLSLNTTEHGYILSDEPLPQSSSPPIILSPNSHSPTSGAARTTLPASLVGSRPRSNTQTSSNSLTQINRDTPLLLRQPLNRPNPPGEPSDPFHSARSEVLDNGAPSRSHSDPAASSPLLVKPPDTSSNLQSNGSGNKFLSTATTNGSPSSPSTPTAASSRLLRRLSTTLFPSSPAPMLTTPIERSSIDLSPSFNLVNGAQFASGMTTPSTSGGGSSPSRSKENLEPISVARNSVEDGKGKQPKPTAPLPEETPEEFLLRLLAAVTRAEVAHVLASRYF